MSPFTNRLPLAACLAIGLVAALPRTGRGDDAPGPALASDLAAESEHGPAAIEYRRLALSEPDATKRAGYYWAAAWQYHLAGKLALAQKMLDRSEDESDNLAAESTLLRAEISLAAHRYDEAEFHLDSLIKREPAPASHGLVSRRLAGTRLRRGDVDGAKRALEAGGHKRELNSVLAYERKSDRRPAIGGILGMIPGLGYAYSAEYANALRSLILNGLFIYAMTDTAADEQWGAFAAVTFFELTWFTGSIYGGIDAAHRYNRDRLNDCLNAVDGQSRFEPDLKQIPVISLKFTF